MKYKKIHNYLNLTRGQFVLIAALIVALELFLSPWILRTEYTSDPRVYFTYWGFPFEAIKVKNTVYSGVYPDLGEIAYVRPTYETLWGGMIMNLIIYIVFSVIVVKLATWIRDEIEYRRYHKL